MRDQVCIDDAIEEVGVDGVVQVGVGVAVEPAGAVAEGVGVVVGTAGAEGGQVGVCR